MRDIDTRPSIRTQILLFTLFGEYILPRRGKRVVQEGQVRIFEPRRTAWDGLWHMVVYSVPEGNRRLRSSLRTRLGWLGFGRLARSEEHTSELQSRLHLVC